MSVAIVAWTAALVCAHWCTCSSAKMASKCWTRLASKDRMAGVEISTVLRDRNAFDNKLNTINSVFISEKIISFRVCFRFCCEANEADHECLPHLGDRASQRSSPNARKLFNICMGLHDTMHTLLSREMMLLYDHDTKAFRSEGELQQRGVHRLAQNVRTRTPFVKDKQRRKEQ